MTPSSDHHHLDYRLLFEKGTHPSLILTPDLHIVAVTDTYLQATMTRREDLLGRHMFDAFPDNPDEPEATGVRNLSASLARVLERKAPDAMAIQKYDVARPGGGFELKYWSPLNTPILDECGHVAYIIHQVEDVTSLVTLQESADQAIQASEHQQREIEVLKQGALFQLLVGQVKEYAIFMLDRQGHVITWNEGAERLSGFAEYEVLGQSYATFFPPESVDEGLPQRLLGEASATGTSNHEGWGVGKGGKRFWAQATITALRDVLGQLVGFAMVIRDITVRAELEYRLKARTAELEATLRALQDTEQKLRSILDNSPAAIFVKDFQGRYLMINRRYEVLFHIRQAEIQGKTDHDIHPREMAEAVRANDLQVQAANAPMAFEEVITQPDGLHTFVSLKFPLYNYAGEPYAVCGIATDITERKRVEEELRRLAAIVRSSSDAIIGLRLDGTIHSWNQGAQAIFGYTGEAIIGHSIGELVPADRRHELEHVLEQVRRGGSISNFETRRIGRDGRAIDVSINATPIRNDSGEVTSLAWIGRDITAQKRAYELLEASEARFRSVIESGPDATLLIDAQGKILMVNAQTERHFGYARQELIGKPAAMLLPEPLRSAIAEQRAQFYEAPTQRVVGEDFGFYCRRKDGTEFPVEISVSPVETPEGRLMIASIRDLTERKRVIEALIQRNVELNRFKEHFLSTTLRDMKAPLALITGYTEQLKDRGPCDALIEGLEDSARRLTEHIEQMLDYSALLSGTVREGGLPEDSATSS